MSLQNLLDLQSAKGRKQGLSEERVREQMQPTRTEPHRQKLGPLSEEPFILR